MDHKRVYGALCIRKTIVKAVLTIAKTVDSEQEVVKYKPHQHLNSVNFPEGHKFEILEKKDHVFFFKFSAKRIERKYI